MIIYLILKSKDFIKAFSRLDNCAKLLQVLEEVFQSQTPVHQITVVLWCFLHGQRPVHLAITLVVKGQGSLHQTEGQRGVWPRGIALRQKTSGEIQHSTRQCEEMNTDSKRLQFERRMWSIMKVQHGVQARKVSYIMGAKKTACVCVCARTPVPTATAQ